MRPAQDAETETGARARGSTGARAGASAGPAAPRGVVRRAGAAARARRPGGDRRADPAPEGNPGGDRRAVRPTDAGWGTAIRIQREASPKTPLAGPPRRAARHLPG